MLFWGKAPRLPRFRSVRGLSGSTVRARLTAEPLYPNTFFYRRFCARISDQKKFYKHLNSLDFAAQRRKASSIEVQLEAAAEVSPSENLEAAVNL